GEGDLVLMGGNGKGGVKIDKDGNIKVWGVQVTIKGRGAVNFNGKVEYDPGAGNEPEDAISVTPEEIPEIEALVSEHELVPSISGLRWRHQLLEVNDMAVMEFAHQDFEAGSTAVIKIFQIEDGTETQVTEISHPLTKNKGVERVEWRPGNDITVGHRFLEDKELLPQTPVQYRFEVEINGTQNTESNILTLAKILKLDMTQDNSNAVRVACYNAYGHSKDVPMSYGRANFRSILLGPVFIEVLETNKEP
ncbi:MAG: hypothetical protein P8X74_23055, partial [Reinekea sp.]